MRYKKYRGRTKKEAIAKARIDLPGVDFYILKDEEIKNGLFIKKKEVEVTVCIVENPYPSNEKENKTEYNPEDIIKKVKETIDLNEDSALPEPDYGNNTENQTNIKENLANFTSKKPEVTDNNKYNGDLEFEKDLKKFLRCGDFDDKFTEDFYNKFSYNNSIKDIYKKSDLINNRELLLKIKKELFKYLKRRIYTVDELKIKKGKNKAVVFIGPTGEGKTTTLIKIIGSLIEQNDFNINIKIVTLDYFRVAAKEQLEMMADIFQKPFESYNKLSDFKKNCDFSENDIIFVDTAGRSQLDEEELSELKKYINLIYVDKVNCLVVSATKKYYDMKNIFQRFEKEIGIDYVILTKLDETNAFGQALSVLAETRKPLIYVTDGQEFASNIHPANIDGLLEINFNKMVDRFYELL